MNYFVDQKPHAAAARPALTQTRFGLFNTELPLFDAAQLTERRSTQSSAQSKPGFACRQIHSRFENIVGGQLTFVDRSGKHEFGNRSNSSDELSATVLVGNDDFYRRIMYGGTIGSAESYVDGQWVTNDLTALIRIMIRNLDMFSKLEKSWAWLKNSWHFIQHCLRKNSIEGSRKNIQEHYDLGNDFYQLFLDPTMNYSSGIFPSPVENSGDACDMHEASIRKMDQVCRKLQLTPTDHVLEIGTGWGGLAIHMAKRFGCRVTTTTISKEQHRFAVERVEAEGLSDRITVLLQDYRQLKGCFDKIVSIEMIEAVGHQFYDEYFSRCSELLADDGVMLLQAITMGEQNFAYHVRHVDFIRRYVFPGGCLPSVTALAGSVGRSTDMRMLYQEDITPHYVKTLASWRQQFMNKLDQVRSQGYDESFIRLWHFYLCYCEAAFAERRVHNIHLMFAKPTCEIDPAVDFCHPESGIRGNWNKQLDREQWRSPDFQVN